jgi:DNA-directed RNA polymerase specialized sigma24 family protein
MSPLPITPNADDEPPPARARALSQACPLSIALRALRRARVAADRVAQERAAKLVAAATRRFYGLFAELGIWGADAEDLRQDLHVRLLAHLDELDAIEHPGAWLRTIAQRLALDWLRKRRRQRTRPCEPATLAESGGSWTLEEATEKEAEERLLAEFRAQAAAWIESYVARADARRAPRGHHVRAWFLRHVEGASIPTIRARLAASCGAISADVASKWIERGGALVRELALADEDAERGEAFLRALEA